MHDIKSQKNQQFNNIKIKPKPEKRIASHKNTIIKPRELADHEPGQEITPVAPAQEDKISKKDEVSDWDASSNEEDNKA